MPHPTDSEGAGEGLPRSKRIRLAGEIRALLRNGVRQKGPLMEVFSAPVSEGRSRFGVIVPKHGRTIVERNLLRRRLREVGRQEVLPYLKREGCHADVLVRSRPEAYDAPFPALREALIRSTERLCSDSSSSA